MTRRELAYAQKLIDARRFAEAAEAAGAVVAREGDDAEALTILSRALRPLGRLDDAYQAASRAVTVEPGSVHGWMELAFVYSAHRDHRHAVSTIEEALRLAPDDWSAHALRAQFLDDFLGPGSDGLVAAREALRLAPDEAAAHLAVGNALRVRGRGRAAREHYREALRLDPADLDAEHNLAVTRAPSEMVTGLMDVARSDPQYVLASYNLRVALGRIFAGTWYIVLAGAVTSLILLGILGYGKAVPWMLLVDAAVVGVVALLCGRALHSSRAGRLVRFVLWADTTLLTLGIILLLGIISLLCFALGPPLMQGIVLVIVWPGLWLAGVVTWLIWRGTIKFDGRQL